MTTKNKLVFNDTNGIYKDRLQTITDSYGYMNMSDTFRRLVDSAYSKITGQDPHLPIVEEPIINIDDDEK